MSLNYEKTRRRSRQLFERAKKVFPAGVSYRIRSIDPYPFYVERAHGCKLIDVDGNRYTDYWCGHFALILGHAPRGVIRAVKEQSSKGFHYGVAHEMELKLAEQITRMVPSIKMLRYCASGTEANMYAIRLARTCTKRSRIGKFEGGWHGGYDALHVATKPPFEQLPSGGLTDGIVKDTIALPYNDLDGVRKIMSQNELASITVEPVMGSGGMIPADKEFLKGLAEICRERGTLLIFDEVITGFRLSPGGAQKKWGLSPDLTVLGKIPGGGLPMGVVGGRQDIMEHMDHTKYEVPDYSFHGGTYTGNPMSATAGFTTLKILENGSVHRKIDKLGQKMRKGLEDTFHRRGFSFQTTGEGSILGCHFAKDPVVDMKSAEAGDKNMSKKFSSHLLNNGIFAISPELVHCAISSAHGEKEINEFISAAEKFTRQEK